MTLKRKLMAIMVVAILGTAGLGWSMTGAGPSGDTSDNHEVCGFCCGLCD